MGIIFRACILLWSISAVFGAMMNEVETCITPYQTAGICKPLGRCPELIALTDTIRSNSRNTVVFLTRSQCHNQSRRNVLHCCPLEPTTTPLIPILEHPNLRLINHEFCGLSVDVGRIVNGHKTTLFEYPWMALLQYRTRTGLVFQCGGSLINDRYILTAAHCVTNNLALTQVRLGEHDYSKEEDCVNLIDHNEEPDCAPRYQDFDIEKVTIHPQFGRGKNDIALIRLARPANISVDNVQSICLPVGPDEYRRRLDGLKMTVAGWGLSNTGRQSTELLKASLPVLPNARCNNVMRGMSLVDSQLCAGGESSDSCQGDSGGPLHMYGSVDSRPIMMQYGIVSFGKKTCGTTGAPAVYTRVTHFMDWILDNIRP